LISGNVENVHKIIAEMLIELW